LSLLDHHVAFVDALRAGGLTISLAEALDAADAVRAVAIDDREVLRAVYAATLVKRQPQRRVFDEMFDLYFPRVLGAGITRPDEIRDAPPPWETADADRLRLRDELRAFLLSGDDADLADLAREAVARLGALPGSAPGAGSGGRPSWSRMTVLDRLSPQTLMAGLLDAFLAEGERGGMAEQVARATIAGRVRRFEQLVDADVRRRMAEQSSVDAIAQTGVRRSVEEIAFLSATRSELVEIRREIAPLARKLAARVAIAHRHGRQGQLDFRRTIRASLSTGGVPVTTHHRPRRPHKTDLVVICDLSQSVSSFAHFTLLLVYALREQFARVRAFGFVDDMDEVTRFFTPGGDVLDAVSRLSQEARVSWLLGRTDYGRAFELFHERYLDAIGPRTSLLVLGDARSNYGDPALAAFGSLANRARHAYWLNPERRAAWDTGDSVASKYAAIVPMVECRNLAQLSAFVKDLPV
jgi:uncharacterized protein with von Willebrand factor type A (vWA) domain